MEANQWQFWLPCRRGDTMRWALSSGAHPWLHAKPLDATIGQVPTPYCPGGRHGRQFWMKHKNTNKTQLLPSFLTVDPHVKAKPFRDPKHTLYSRQQCNKLRTNVKHHFSSWRMQLHFELSNVVNRQKFKKLLTLNKAQENLWAKYGPISAKLLRPRHILLSLLLFNLPAQLKETTPPHTFCRGHLSSPILFLLLTPPTFIWLLCLLKMTAT